VIRDLVRNALRMRPDRIIVGECRSAEALDMLQAMNTGHEGSMTTVHANSPRDAMSRLEMMVLMAGFDLPTRVVREQVTAAIDVVVQVRAPARRAPGGHLAVGAHRGWRATSIVHAGGVPPADALERRGAEATLIATGLRPSAGRPAPRGGHHPAGPPVPPAPVDGGLSAVDVELLLAVVALGLGGLVLVAATVDRARHREVPLAELLGLPTPPLDPRAPDPAGELGTVAAGSLHLANRALHRWDRRGTLRDRIEQADLGAAAGRAGRDRRRRRPGRRRRPRRPDRRGLGGARCPSPPLPSSPGGSSPPGPGAGPPASPPSSPTPSAWSPARSPPATPSSGRSS
jgi:hypothetical protein